ncbi:hypothetical protein BDZ97DRAFT_1739587 [Flammula alnicola]|nr:hypothetical protein BDZ97DRAFT_1739587 [Flammula alnicola]
MIIDDKVILLSPPPYQSSCSSYGDSTPTLTSLPLISNPNSKPTLTYLSPHILLQIIHTVLHGKPQLPTYNPHDRYDAAYYEETKPERQRKILFWLSTSLRLVSRQLYIASMHELRSTYLPAYQAMIRPGYSSDPFPMGTPVLDRFILLKVRQDVFADESELHMDREDAFRDLFDVAQPRGRLEDLVRIYGVREGVVSNSTTSSKNPSFHQQQTQQQRTPKFTPLPFPSLSISFSPRRIGLVLNRGRTIAEVLRVPGKKEPLEVLAWGLVRELKAELGAS